MDLLEAVTAVLGLAFFEIVNSVDNAIVNAHVLATMGEKWRKRFLTWGMFTSVFLVRFVIPLLILWVVNQNLSPLEILVSSIGGNPEAARHVEENKGLILMAGGMFLLLLYAHWFFMEEKEHLFPHEKIGLRFKVWFYAFAALSLLVILWLARYNPYLMLSAAFGNAMFFILHGFKQTAEQEEEALLRREVTDFAKFMYLEVLDMTFSFDGIVGAFAFTVSLLLITLGNGLGALVVREMTLKGMESIGKYRFLKNGAMTSIGFLGVFMLIEAFGYELPALVPTLTTFALVGFAYWRSKHA